MKRSYSISLVLMLAFAIGCANSLEPAPPDQTQSELFLPDSLLQRVGLMQVENDGSHWVERTISGTHDTVLAPLFRRSGTVNWHYPRRIVYNDFFSRSMDGHSLRYNHEIEILTDSVGRYLSAVVAHDHSSSEKAPPTSWDYNEAFRVDSLRVVFLSADTAILEREVLDASSFSWVSESYSNAEGTVNQRYLFSETPFTMRVRLVFKK